MKVFLALSAIVLGAQALPTGYLGANTTAELRSARSFGFASVSGGTRGGQGGAVWTVWDAWALRDAVAGTTARVVTVRGRIDLGVLFTASPGVVVDVGSWKTIIGGDRNAEITGGGLRIRRNVQVIIQNIKFNNAISYAPGERPNGSGGILNQVAGEFTEIDAILCEEATHVWIDHNEFSDDPWNANTVANNRMRHDGLVDIKRGSNWITVSHNIFRNHNKNMLIGHSDGNAAQDVGRLKTSIQANWFRGVRQRNPRVRYGEVHIVNNLYSDIISYAIGVGAGASIHSERNAFVNTRRAWGFPDGTPNPIGNLASTQDHFVNSDFDRGIPNAVRWQPHQYFQYAVVGSANVEAHVRAVAGTW